MPKTGRKTRSIRGEIVDFDLMDIKAQMASAPKTVEVTAREDFIERRLRRRARRIADKQAELAKKAEEQTDAETPKQAEVAVAPKSAPRPEEQKPNALKHLAETKVEEKKPEPVAEEQPRRRRIVKRKSED